MLGRRVMQPLLRHFKLYGMLVRLAWLYVLRLRLVRCAVVLDRLLEAGTRAHLDAFVCGSGKMSQVVRAAASFRRDSRFVWPVMDRRSWHD